MPPARLRQLSFSGAFGVGNFKAGPTTFFILRNPITGEERRDIFVPDGKTTMISAGGSLQFDNVFNLFGTPYGSSITFTYNTANGSTTTTSGTIDPLGQQLGIIGTGDPNAPFPQGVLLGSGVPLGTAGGFNVLTDVFYRRNLNITAFGTEVTLGTFSFGPPGQFGRVSVTPIVGFSYTRMEISERTSFSVARFLTDGRYNSDYVSDIFTPSIGMRVDVPIEFAAFTLIPYVQGSWGVGFSEVEGTDRLALSGFLNTLQQVGLSGDHSGCYGSVAAGVRFTAGNFFADGSVTTAAGLPYPRLYRSGEVGETTQVHFGRATSTTFMFRGGFSF